MKCIRKSWSSRICMINVIKFLQETSIYFSIMTFLEELKLTRILNRHIKFWNFQNIWLCVVIIIIDYIGSILNIMNYIWLNIDTLASFHLNAVRIMPFISIDTILIIIKIRYIYRVPLLRNDCLTFYMYYIHINLNLS